MMNMLVAGSRGSQLALKQTREVIALLSACDSSLQFKIETIKTQGDHLLHIPLAQIEGKGLFTKELEQSLLSGQVDFAVHSLKDLPVDVPDGLTIVAYIPREIPNDVLISKNNLSLDAIPARGVIATGSLRRKLQLLRYRSDLRIVDVRGNVETRLRKLRENDWDALILAYAGLKRLGKTDVISEIISQEVLYPAVGQGIIAIECRDDPAFKKLFANIADPVTTILARAERAFLRGLGGGCQIPVGVMSSVQGGKVRLCGRYMPEDGKYVIERNVEERTMMAAAAGQRLAEDILRAYDAIN